MLMVNVQYLQRKNISISIWFNGCEAGCTLAAIGHRVPNVSLFRVEFNSGVIYLFQINRRKVDGDRTETELPQQSPSGILYNLL